MTSHQVTARAVLFDLDGVLVNSQAAIDGVWTRWTQRHGLDPDAVLPNIHGRRSTDIVRRFAPFADLQREVDWLLAAEIESAVGLQPYPGAAALLLALGPERHAVVTSGSRALATARLTHAGLPLPSVMVPADGVQKGKPDPEGYLKAAELLNIPIGDCVVIEDAPAGIAAGRAAGARVIGLATSMPPDTLAAAHLLLSSLDRIELIAGNGRSNTFTISVRDGILAAPHTLG